MPKQRIKEIDNTGVALQFVGLNTVYIPGGTGKLSKTDPILYTSYSKFIEAVSEYEYADDKSFKMAKRLLQLGLPVLYQGFPLNNLSYTAGMFTTRITVTLEPVEDSQTGETWAKQVFTINGINYIVGDTHLPAPANVPNTVCSYVVNPTTGAITYTNEGVISNGIVDLGVIPGSQITTKQIFTFDFGSSLVYYTVKKVATGSNITITSDDWWELQDRNLYDVRFITTGGHPEATSSVMIDVAAKRGDSVALIDHTSDKNTVALVREAIEGIAMVNYTTIFQPVAESDNMCRSFGAAFTPWFTAKWDDVNEEFPASFGYLLAFARSAAAGNPIWVATAGSFRGMIPELVDVNVHYTNAECEMLGARAKDEEVDIDGIGDNVGIAINPIAYRRPYGYLIWGDRTLRENDGKLKATSQLHSRVLCSELNKALYQAANKYTFEQNTDVLWINFKSEVNPLLEQMKSGEGIGDFKWTRLASNKRARVNAKVAITPIDAVEDFDITIYMENSIDITE